MQLTIVLLHVIGYAHMQARHCKKQVSSNSFALSHSDTSIVTFNTVHTLYTLTSCVITFTFTSFPQGCGHSALCMTGQDRTRKLVACRRCSSCGNQPDSHTRSTTHPLKAKGPLWGPSGQLPLSRLKTKRLTAAAAQMVRAPWSGPNRQVRW